ncbi:MAG: AmmeMemoRadiSam system protein B [Terracidiphilus sp.]
MREAGVAGSFYPADPAHLRGMMDVMLAGVDKHPVEGEVLALVAPHAGYVYSGPVAAYSYAALKGHPYSRVIVIAPSHFVAFSFTSVYDGDAYETPLGVIPVDKDFARRLSEADPASRLSDRGHAHTPQGSEHALEVQLPWLQHVLGSFALVPIVMGNQSYAASRSLGGALATLLRDESDDAHHHGTPEKRSTLIVATSDLSHYASAESASAMDRRTLLALESWDYFSMARNFESQVWEACGGGPIVTAMIASERLGATRAQVLKYAHSGDVTGDTASVVGYSADVFIKSPEAEPMLHPFQLSREEKDELLDLARHAVEAAVRGEPAFQPEAPPSETLHHERGAFVTLRAGKDLRGCIGYTAATRPLYLTVRDTAALAAMHDPRFRPVSADELPSLTCEISVLSPLRRIQNIHEIRIGKDGLFIRNGDREGLLLPQVATEQGWDAFRFLEEICVKAGLPRDSWTSEDTDIFAFTAIVFSADEEAPQTLPSSPLDAI